MSAAASFPSTSVCAIMHGSGVTRNKDVCMARGAPGVRRGQRGEAQRRLETLAATYEAAQRGRRKRVPISSIDPLLDATGDPLLSKDRKLADELYGLSSAARPTAHIRRLRASLFGDALASVVSVARRIKERRSCSDTMAAAEAVSLSAQRGTFLGVGSPLDFSRATELARKALSKAANLGPDPRAWTGDWLFVVPVPGGTVPMPDGFGRYLPERGAWVPDSLFWRQRLSHLDVVLQDRRKEKPPTN